MYVGGKRLKQVRGSRLRAYAALFRVSGAVTPAADVVTGYLCIPGPGGHSVPYLSLAAACLASMAVFCAGAALNDLTDRDRDAHSAPHRPLPSGALTPSAARYAVLAAGSIALLLAAMVGTATLGATAFVLALCGVYDGWNRVRASVGLVLLALIRAADLLVGASLHLSRTGIEGLFRTQGPGVPAPWVLVLYGAYALALSLTALSERGERRPTPLPAILAVLAVVPAAFAAWRAGHPVPAGVLLGCLGLPVYAHFTGQNASRTERLVGHFVSGYFLTGALFVLARGRIGACAFLWAGYFLSRALSRAFPAG